MSVMRYTGTEDFGHPPALRRGTTVGRVPAGGTPTGGTDPKRSAPTITTAPRTKTVGGPRDFCFPGVQHHDGRRA